jgi:hypothetical protein
VTKGDEQSAPSSRKRIRIGGDELSTLRREEIDEANPPPLIEESIAFWVEQFRRELIEKGWPDPCLRHVWRDGCPTGEVEDDQLESKIATGQIAPDDRTLPGWQTLHLLFEARGFSLGDDWYRAKLIGIGIDALYGEGEGRTRALVNFGYYFRDWTARRSFGSKAKSKLKIERNANPLLNPAIAAANAQRRIRSQSWKAAVTVIAAEKWRLKPSATASELAPRVHAELRKRFEVGELPDITKLPAVRTVRNELFRLRPKR